MKTKVKERTWEAGELYEGQGISTGWGCWDCWSDKHRYFGEEKVFLVFPSPVDTKEDILVFFYSLILENMALSPNYFDVSQIDATAHNLPPSTTHFP